MFNQLNSYVRAVSGAVARLKADTSGAALVEMGMVLPFLIFLTAGGIVVQDAIRVTYLQSKAAYTVSDMVSREDNFIDSGYFDGMDSIYRFLTNNSYPTELRMSTVECTADCADQAQRVLEFCWSESTDGLTDLTNAQMIFYADRIPLFAEGDTLLMTEAFLDYTPWFGDLIISAQTFDSIAFTRPRLAPQIKFDTGAIDTDGNQIIRDCFNN
ncbi:hypothetical protein NBRC116589_10560 [Ruegeria sp. HU-ET01832]|uniref:TadE/TadG family type IV pilus assembly protein n=1 Tax=Ruegeria sp. HU-ET01832 TaxID=3135906 RepID=UPI003103818C